MTPPKTVQDIIDAGCCREYREHPERLAEIWAGENTLSANQMLHKGQVPLGDRVWAIMQAEPDIDWPTISAQLYALVDPTKYPAAEGEINLAAKLGSDAYTAAYHVEAYAAEIGNNSPVANATNLIKEALP